MICKNTGLVDIVHVLSNSMSFFLFISLMPTLSLGAHSPCHLSALFPLTKPAQSSRGGRNGQFWQTSMVVVVVVVVMVVMVFKMFMLVMLVEIFEEIIFGQSYFGHGVKG